MSPDRYIILDGMELFVFNSVFSDDVIAQVDRKVRDLSFGSRNSSNNETRDYREWASHFSPEEFKSHPIGKKTLELFKTLYPETEFDLWEVHCNSTVFGDWAFAHQDSTHERAYSALYYANSKWEHDWYGETVFYNSREARLAISALPGRLVLFDSRIKHRGGVPSRNCSRQRFSLSIRFEASRLGHCTLDMDAERF